MKRFLIYCLILIGGGYAIWQLPAAPLRLHTARSSTVRLEPIGYDLTYTVAWGWGMEQKFTLDPAGAIMAGPSSGWLEIWDKPYYAVLSVYRSVDGMTYYFGPGWASSFAWARSSDQLKRFCSLASVLKLTPLGARLVALKDHREVDDADPGAPRLREYVKAEDQGGIPASPPRSRYYADLLYLGKFGVVGRHHGSGRGENVAFVPADRAPEPRFALNPDCG